MRSVGIRNLNRSREADRPRLLRDMHESCPHILDSILDASIRFAGHMYTRDETVQSNEYSTIHVCMSHVTRMYESCHTYV